MNAAETTIAAAIEKLTDLRDATTTDEGSAPVWRAEHHRVGGAAIFAEDDNALAVGLDDADAELIVTLHRSIDAQLAILRYAQADYYRWYGPTGYEEGDGDAEPYFVWVLGLAEAILGGSL